MNWLDYLEMRLQEQVAPYVGHTTLTEPTLLNLQTLADQVVDQVKHEMVSAGLRPGVGEPDLRVELWANPYRGTVHFCARWVERQTFIAEASCGTP